MRALKICLSFLVVLALASSASFAWELRGYVRCDGNKNGVLDGQDLPLAGVVVHVENIGGTYQNNGTTNADGYYQVTLLDAPENYRATLSPGSLPADGVVVVPAGGELLFAASDVNIVTYADWLVQSDTCQPGACWMTGGGTKWDNIAGAYLAEKGTKQTFGGNVHPGCSPTAGRGGEWNHIDRGTKLHFHGTDIPDVRCGNVEGIPPGSSSPKTPFNFIEYAGTGWVKGVQGNKADYPLVYFYARAEDRNEPGSNGAKAGSQIDRYFLRVFTSTADPIGSTLILVDTDGGGGEIDATPITTGNLQIHVSSCDDPPLN